LQLMELVPMSRTPSLLTKSSPFIQRGKPKGVALLLASLLGKKLVKSNQFPSHRPHRQKSDNLPQS
jgi:hypothetical protein